jgi:chemotaxis protein MotB
MLADQLKLLPNKLLLEGHTDARPFSVEGSYSNWELSTDRANTARRLFQESGVSQSQINQVRGFADRRLRNAKDPDDASNRRVSVIVQYMELPPAEAGPGKKGEAKPGDAKKGEVKPSAAEQKAPPPPSPVAAGKPPAPPAQAASSSGKSAAPPPAPANSTKAPVPVHK